MMKFRVSSQKMMKKLKKEYGDARKFVVEQRRKITTSF
jgi:hypothetical protein